MFTGLATSYLLITLGLCAAVVTACGVRMTGVADRIADRTGLGEALIGAVLLGAATSMSGTIVSFTAALDGRASLAFSNAVGGIAAQTAFLAFGDLIYRRANLEHAAAEISSILQVSLLSLLLAIPLLAATGPAISIFGVHPASIVLVVTYVAGTILSKKVRDNPMWHPVTTAETQHDKPAETQKDAARNLALFVQFGLLMVVMGVAGWLIARLAGVLIDRHELSASLVGALVTAVLTSLPELVTTLAAIRRGALQLAVGGIIGGNSFDTLFLATSDIGYREGSIYHALQLGDFYWLAAGLTMTAIMHLGLIVRQKTGPAGIGFESAAILAVYALVILTHVFH